MREPDVPEGVSTALRAIQKLGVDFIRRYNRLEIEGGDLELDGPVLFVANHGFGGLFDLNVFAVLAAFTQMGIERDVTALAHQSTWTMRLGKYVEPMGVRPASRASAMDAFADGRHVLVLPGGDLDAFKSWADRNKIIFGGRRGFVRLALEAGVPIVPIVTAGGTEAVISLPGGECLSRTLGLDKSLRLKTLPISFSLPFGLNIGAAGALPFLPLPTKLFTAVLAPMTPAEGETADQFGDRIEAAMQAKLDQMTEGRIPLLG